MFTWMILVHPLQLIYASLPSSFHFTTIPNPQLLSTCSKAFSIPIFLSSPFNCAMRLLLFSSLLFSALISAIASNHTQYKPCIQDHFSALLNVKQCFRYNPRDNPLFSWNEEDKDCCSWYGVRCDGSTGQVISLDVAHARIKSQEEFDNILRLRSLQQLYISGDVASFSRFPSRLDRLANLTHLHLSNFYGQIPQDISHLRNLVSLHLSGPSNPMTIPLQLRGSTLRSLMQNVPSLEELQFSYVVTSAQGHKWGKALSVLPNLRILTMTNCHLSGPIHSSLSQLHFLSELDLSFNNLSSPVPTFIANFSSLLKLSLAGCDLQGKFPPSIFNLPNISHVEIDENPNLIISFPEFTQNNSLQSLALSNTSFLGQLPYSMGNLRELSSLNARNCSLSGPIPSSLVNLTSLRYLDLSFNNLSGPLPSSYSTDELGRLQSVDLSYNMLNGTIPSLFFLLPSLQKLYLESNKFNGFAGELQNMSFSTLVQLYLQNNNLQGPIPRFIFQLKNLLQLDLSANNFSGIVDLSSFSQLKNLEWLSLSDSRFCSIQDGGGNSTFPPFPRLKVLSLHSSNVTGFPDVLRKVKQLSRLDLSNNTISGRIPQWIWTLGSGDFSYLNLSHNWLVGFAQPFSNLSLSSWQYIDLSFNKLEGSMMIPSQSTSLYSVANNFFSGEVPSLICNLTSLRVLDLSYNCFSGSVQPCLGEISNSLDVLNLQGNAFHGTLNLTFKDGCTLRTLDVSGNYLKGQVPKSMANCSYLEFLNLGDNQIHDTFPSWLEKLPSLRVLVLKSNKFYGAIGLNAGDRASFPQLQIFDVSSNGFMGSLPRNIFKSWKKMIGDNESLSALSRFVEIDKVRSDPSKIRKRMITYDFLLPAPKDEVYYQDRVTVVLKGTEHKLEKILTAFTLIDLSNNKFHGSIPKSVGGLRSLLSLNLSHNSFTGQIPASLENLKFLETLDLSQNSLSGEIPTQLTKLNFLAVLNLSHNLLVGAIPQGQQFSTFSNDSFLSNSGLCGPPLSRKCVEDNNTLPLSKQSQGKFDWSFLWSGFAVGHGVGVGLFFWTLALWTKGRIEFILFIDKVLLFIFPSGVFYPIRRR